MAEQLFFSRDSKMYIEFNNAVWEVPVLDGFSFSQSTNQSEISLSEMQGADGLSRRGNRVFTDSLAPAEWSFSTYVRPYKLGTESHAVEEALWAVMAGADRYIDLMADNGIGTINTTGTISGATNGTYRITSANSTVAANNAGSANTTAAGYELRLTVTGGNTAAVSIVRAGEGFAANDDITIPASVHGGSGALTVEVATLNAKGVIGSVAVNQNSSGASPGTYQITTQNSSVTTGTAVAYDITIVVAANGTVTATPSITDGGTNATSNAVITVPTTTIGGSQALTLDVTLASGTANDAGPNFYRAVNPDTNSTHGPAVVQPGDSTTINFGQSNRSTLGECNLYFVMETSATNPMVYKLQNAAFNEASLDFEVDGIATINWSGFAKNIIDMQSSTTAGSSVTVQTTKTISGNSSTGSAFAAGDVVLYSSDGLKLGVVQSSSSANFAKDTGVDSTATFIRNRLTQLLVSTSDTTAFPNASIAGGTGSYSLTLTGGNITISNNISYLVPEELGAVNIPIEHVTGGRTASGSFTCYLTFDADKQGTSVDLFNDMTAPGAGLGLEKVVNDFAVTFQVGGAVSGQPRLDVTIPKCHINVPAHSIEDVISVETNFAAYTDEFNVANEIELTYHGTAI